MEGMAFGTGQHETAHTPWIPRQQAPDRPAAGRAPARTTAAYTARCTAPAGKGHGTAPGTKPPAPALRQHLRDLRPLCIAAFGTRSCLRGRGTALRGRARPARLGHSLIRRSRSMSGSTPSVTSPAPRPCCARQRSAVAAAVCGADRRSAGLASPHRAHRRRAGSPRLPAEEYALSAIARPGRRRGLPRPRRAMRIASISGMNRGEPPCWPGLVSRATGRQRRSAAR